MDHNGLLALLEERDRHDARIKAAHAVVYARLQYYRALLGIQWRARARGRLLTIVGYDAVEIVLQRAFWECVTAQTIWDEDNLILLLFDMLFTDGYEVGGFIDSDFNLDMQSWSEQQFHDNYITWLNCCFRRAYDQIA